ncbi:MAG TPA: DPP IV N-terminal domain-containing protein, partial [Balneolaceae bacterium]|nr:DPP IV N-terminal domain-containing protein [Balneolaceae bacterium]
LYKVEGSSRALEGNHARWSPDGSKVAFDLCLNCQIRTNNDIYLFDTRSKQLTQLTQDSASDTNPTWSPDGSRIAFVSDRDYLEADTMRYRTDLYIVYADGSNLSRLTQTGNATRPAWNPNGKTIAYEWNRQGNNIFLVNVSTGNITTVKSGLQFSGYPMWNKDGTKMLVSGRVIEKSKPEMRLLNIMDSSADIFQKIELDEKAVGRDYDWYISSKN